MEPRKAVLWADQREGHQISNPQRWTEMLLRPGGRVQVVGLQGRVVTAISTETVGGLDAVKLPNILKPPQTQRNRHPFRTASNTSRKVHLPGVVLMAASCRVARRELVSAAMSHATPRWSNGFRMWVGQRRPMPCTIGSRVPLAS